MKKQFLYFSTLAFTLFIACTSAQLNQVTKDLNGVTNNGTKAPALTNDEVISGLREALSVGTNNSSGAASKLDGFYKNPTHPEIFIPFPPEAQKVKDKMIELGFKDRVDKFEMTMNRGAEEAAKNAAPIFLDAIKGMTIGDGFSILKGGDGAATQYLKDKTTTQLHDKFKPVVQQALNTVKLTEYWKPVIETYNKIPFVEKQNPDLEEYVTQRAINGLFILIASEEFKIRKDPAARVSDILKKVFGSQY